MILSLLLAAASLSADTIAVQTAKRETPYTLHTPYRTDSVNMKEKAFDLTESLRLNASLVKPSSVRTPSFTTIQRNEPLTVGADSLPTLHLIRFSVETPRFLTATINVEKAGNYKWYVDGKEQSDSRLRLTPGRAEIALQVLTTKTSRDTFRVSLIGEKLKDVRINPTSKRPYTMADMLLGEHYRRVRISPSGRYLVTTISLTEKDGKQSYRTVLSETKTERVIRRWDEHISLSWLETNQDALYFTRKGIAGRELIVYYPEEGREEILGDNLPEGGFRVSPNGDYVIVNHSEEGKKPEGALKRLNEPDDRMEHWRNRNALLRYDLRTGVCERLTFGKHSVNLADISSDGRHLLLQTYDFNANRVPFDRTTFIQMDAYNGKTDTLLSDTAFVASARYSPEGDRLLICASPMAFDGIGSDLPPDVPANAFDNRLFLYDIAEKQVKPLLCDFAPSVDNYEWNKGDGMIYMLTTEGTGTTLYRLNPENGTVLPYVMPVSSIEGYSIARNGNRPQVVFFGQSGERAREMFTCQLGNKSLPETKPIGSISFEKHYKDVAIGSCSVWRFKAERGDTIDGFCILPPDFDESKSYPLIVYYYGGCMPTSMCLEYQYPLQVLAGQGYVIYVPNPSGTVGYGQEFAARHVNTWGRETADDIIQGTKAFLSAHPFVDSKRVGCIGASYGGFMTQYLQTRTDLFAAAISHAGISNIASYWGGGYWGYSYGEVAQYGSYPWNNPTLYVEQSPLFHADKIHTPLLLLHGTVDTNVPTNESQQLYNALKILGRDVSFIQVEGENHVITDYKKRLAWQDAIFAWFAKYLQNDDSWWKEIQQRM